MAGVPLTYAALAAAGDSTARYGSCVGRLDLSCCVLGRRATTVGTSWLSLWHLLRTYECEQLAAVVLEWLCICRPAVEFVTAGERSGAWLVFDTGMGGHVPVWMPFLSVAAAASVIRQRRPVPLVPVIHPRRVPHDDAFECLPFVS